MSAVTDTTISPEDPKWDNGEPLTPAGKARRRKNLKMLEDMPGGERLYRIVRHFPYGGSQESPRLRPRAFLVRAAGGAQAKRLVQDEIDIATDGLSAGRGRR